MTVKYRIVNRSGTLGRRRGHCSRTSDRLFIMCGIVGFMDKTAATAPVGQHLLQMLTALGSRGPDSAGVALFGPAAGGLVLRVSLGETADYRAASEDVLHRAAAVAQV